MDTDIKRRLQTVSQSLHLRAIEHSPGPDRDTSAIMKGLAIALEALQALGNDVDGLYGALASVESRVKRQ